jgi:hypothetical protein
MGKAIWPSWERALSRAVLPGLLALVGVTSLLAGPHPLGGEQARGPQRPSAQIKAMVFNEELSIGVPEGDEDYMFGSSVVFNVDEQGNIYATDWESKQVKKYGPDGKHVLTFGRAGQGPGEFRNPGGVRFTKDGNLYISENFGNKIIFFDRNGIYLRQSILPADIFDIWITPAGTYLGNEQAAPQYVGQGPVENFIKIYDGSFKSILELHRDSFVFPDRSLAPAQAQAQITNEFLSRPSAVAVMGDNGRIYFGRSDVYAIDVLAPEGKKLMTISRAVEPLPYRQADIDFVLKEDEERMTSMMRSEALTKEYLRLIRFPKNKPFFRALVPMDEGGLAVVVDIEGYSATWIDLFDRQGQCLGRVRVPVPMLNMIFRNGKAYTLHRDENGFLSIKRYGYGIQRAR